MVRPKKNRVVSFSPGISYFKPKGVPVAELKEVRLTIDEVESIRLSDLLGLSYEEAGKRMGVSRATFGRIIQKARKDIADAVINGKAIRIEGGHFTLADVVPNQFSCEGCGHHWESAESQPEKCPSCDGKYFQEKKK